MEIDVPEEQPQPAGSGAKGSRTERKGAANSPVSGPRGEEACAKATSVNRQRALEFKNSEFCQLTRKIGKATAQWEEALTKAKAARKRIKAEHAAEARASKAAQAKERIAREKAKAAAKERVEGLLLKMSGISIEEAPLRAEGPAVNKAAMVGWASQAKTEWPSSYALTEKKAAFNLTTALAMDDVVEQQSGVREYGKLCRDARTYHSTFRAMGPRRILSKRLGRAK